MIEEFWPFVHSSVDRQLGHLQILAVKNISAINIQIGVIVRTQVIFQRYLGEKLLGGMVRACLTL